VGGVLTDFDGVLTGAPTYRGALDGLEGPGTNAKFATV